MGSNRGSTFRLLAAGPQICSAGRSKTRYNWLWCKLWTRVVDRDNGRNDRTSTGPVQGTAFRPRRHRAVRPVVSQLQVELARSSPDDERGIALARTTILRRVQRYVPDFEKRWSQYARSVGGSWRCDETYIKVKGRWTYLYRAVDKQGRTVDFLLSERRDVAAAKRFFRNAIKNNGIPRVVTLDAYAASHRAIAELKSAGTLPRRVRIRSSKYLNNVVEQDHRRIKQRIRPMLGFKRFDTAAVTITGIELAQKTKNDQFKIGQLSGRPGTAP